MNSAVILLSARSIRTVFREAWLFKGELHSDLSNLIIINKLQFPLIYHALFLKYQKNDNRF